MMAPDKVPSWWIVFSLIVQLAGLLDKLEDCVYAVYENGTMKGMFDMGRAKTDRHGAKAGDWIKYVI